MVKIKVKTTKPMKLAYMSHTGPYDQVPWEEYMGRLYAWAKEHKVRPGFKAIGIYYDNPEEVQSEACRSEVAIHFKGDAASGDDVQIKELPAMKVAEFKFKGPTTELSNAYRKIMTWMQENSFTGAGPSMEIYTSRPKEKAGEMILSTRIQVPIKEQ